MACETCSNETCVCADGIPLDTLASLANTPQTVTVDGQTVTERSAQDIIALDNHVRAKKRSCSNNGNGWGSIGVARAINPDGTGE